MEKSNEIKAGATIVVSAIILVAFLIVIFGVDFGEQTKEYQTYLNYIGGIQQGSLVKYGGMDVGSVTEIALPEGDNTRIRLKIKIDDKTPVRIDSKAFVTSIGIMADQHIEISAGSLNSPLLPAGSVIQSKEVLGFAQMAEPLGELNEQVQELLTRVSDVFNEQNRQHIGSVLANFDNIMTQGQKQFLSVVQNLDHLTAHMASISEDLNDLMDKNKGNFDQTLGHLQKTTEETTKLIADLRHTMSTLESILSANTTSIVDIMENFQYASQNMEEFTRTVKERPWLLIRKDAPPERKLP
jgi:phospholipid/cholesterol/gamma-HCH transport system substrate-binding protein